MTSRSLAVVPALAVTLACSPAPTPPIVTSPAPPLAPVPTHDSARLRAVVLVHRAADLAGDFLEGQTSYPARDGVSVDLLAWAVRSCYEDRFGTARARPDTFGRDVGKLTLRAIHGRTSFSRVEVRGSSWGDPPLEHCAARALARVTLGASELEELPLKPGEAVEIEVHLTLENGEYVRQAQAERVLRADVIRFRETDPRIVGTSPRTNAGKVRQLDVAGIRCPEGSAALAEQRLGDGRVLLERDPRAQPGISFDAWTEAYVRLPDGRDYGLVLIQEGVCADAGTSHPRSDRYRNAMFSRSARP